MRNEIIQDDLPGMEIYFPKTVSAEIVAQDVRSLMLEKACSVVMECLDSKDEQLRFKAAALVIKEMKPEKPVKTEDNALTDNKLNSIFGVN